MIEKKKKPKEMIEKKERKKTIDDRRKGKNWEGKDKIYSVKKNMKD